MTRSPRAQRRYRLAVSNANAGETICVAAGSYRENVNVYKRLTLRGEGAGVVTVTAADSGSNVFEVAAGHVNISGFTATGAIGSGKAGIYLDNRTYIYGHVDHCNISENNCSNNYWGIYLLYSSNDNMLESNDVNSNDDGIYMTSSSDNMLSSNNVSSNNDYGIYLCSSCNNTLVNNTASNNGFGIIMYTSSNNNMFRRNSCGIDMYSSSNSTFTSNNVSSNGEDGIHLYASSSYNTLTRNRCSNNVNDGIHLQYSCDNDITCNLVQNNTDCGIYLTSGSIGNNIAWTNIVANGELQTDGSYHYQFKNYQSDGVDATNNFWGTGMNNSMIDASIYDGWGEVESYPFATEPVPCAPTPISEESPVFTTADALIALRIAVGSRPLDLHWDVSGDGQVTSLDALMIAMDART